MRKGWTDYRSEVDMPPPLAPLAAGFKAALVESGYGVHPLDRSFGRSDAGGSRIASTDRCGAHDPIDGCPRAALQGRDELLTDEAQLVGGNSSHLFATPLEPSTRPPRPADQYPPGAVPHQATEVRGDPRERAADRVVAVAIDEEPVDVPSIPSSLVVRPRRVAILDGVELHGHKDSRRCNRSGRSQDAVGFGNERARGRGLQRPGV